jgi:RNA polymerase sigma factor (sigma-70 family)
LGDARSTSDPLATNPSIFLRLNRTERAPRELAWAEFRARYEPVIAAFARRFGVTSHNADDVVQEVLVGFFAKSPTFVYDPARGRFRSYLKACTVHALQKQVKRARARPTVALGEVDPAAPEVERAWDELWSQQLLKRALEQTRAQYKDKGTFRAFILTAIDGKSPADAATELGMSLANVYKARARVTEAVRNRLEALGAEEG